jgi:hypothetical protein
MEEKIINGKCIVCGKSILIELKEGGGYIGGHYFVIFSFPVGKGEHKKIGGAKLNSKSCDVVKWNGKEKVEYLECEKCYNVD